jgi:hypothetical protein
MYNAPLDMDNGQPPPANSRWRPPPGGRGFAGLGEIYSRKLPNYPGRNDAAARGAIASVIPVRGLFAGPFVNSTPAPASGRQAAVREVWRASV